MCPLIKHGWGNIVCIEFHYYDDDDFVINEINDSDNEE